MGYSFVATRFAAKGYSFAATRFAAMGYSFVATRFAALLLLDCCKWVTLLLLLDFLQMGYNFQERLLVTQTPRYLNLTNSEISFV